MNPSQPLRLLLLVCVAFFLFMGTAHFFGIKVPFLFVYYDTPFYAYQDRIISFSLVSYACLFFAASRDRAVVPLALIALWVTVLGLAYVNQSAELAQVLQSQGTTIYWLQTAVFAGLAAVLTFLTLRERNNT